MHLGKGETMKEKISKNRAQILTIFIFGMFPLVCALVYTLKDGYTPFDVYLPASYWNDELMYYKQVENVVKEGLSKGWFGFNEAHGAVYPFAAWSPVILVPWIVWGKLFGWNLTAPIVSSIVFSMIALAVFAWMVKPSVKESCIFLGLLAVFVPYTRYLLCGMPEAIFMALGIVFMGFSIRYCRREKISDLAVLFGICVFLMLARPYLGLFFLLPLWFGIKKYRWKGALAGVAAIGVTTLLYLWLAKNCIAPYLEPIMLTGWLSLFWEEGPGAGVSYAVNTLLDRFKTLFGEYFKKAVKYGHFPGSLFAVTGFTALLLGIRYVWALARKKEKELRSLWLFQFVITAGMVLALFLFYNMVDGSKHLMIFIVMAICLIAFAKEKYPVMKLLMAFVCVYFFMIKAIAPYDWQVAYDNGVLGIEAAELGSGLDQTMHLADSSDRFDNTVIWLASDVVDGESIVATWGLLYMVPEGFGINFCTQEYVMEHFDTLSSRYLAVLPGGEVEARLQESGAKCLAGTEHMAVYCRE